MSITIFTIFPEQFTNLIAKYPSVGVVDLKTYAHGSYRHIDDAPFGGGAGMVMRYQVLHDALEDYRSSTSYVLALAPIGTPLSKQKMETYKDSSDLLLLCGHYEGMDARIYDEVDEIISLGDFVLSGGEVAAMVFVVSLLGNGVECTVESR